MLPHLQKVRKLHLQKEKKVLRLLKAKKLLKAKRLLLKRLQLLKSHRLLKMVSSRL